MAGIVRLKATMYITLALIFAVAFGIIYAVMSYIGLGILLVLPITVLFFIFQWYISPVLMGAMSRLKYLEPGENQKLQDMVKRLADQAGVPAPRVAIAPRQDPNAYVFGRSRKSSTLVVHQGLLPMLNDSELESVIGHEIGHLRHNDVAIMMVVSFIPMLLYIVAQNMIFAGAFSGGGRGGNGSTAAAVGWGAFVFYFILQLMTLSLSRARESYADEYSATTVKRPQSLASSLLKISTYNLAEPSRQAANDSATAKALYFANPFTSAGEIEEIKAHEADLKELLPDLNIDSFVRQMQKERGGAHGLLFTLFSNHPPIYRRVLDLAEMKKDIVG